MNQKVVQHAGINDGFTPAIQTGLVQHLLPADRGAGGASPRPPALLDSPGAIDSGRGVQGASMTPRWVWWTLLAGAALLAFWAWFVFGFRSEPSVVGRSRVALDLVVGGSIASALVASGAAVALLARRRWAPRLALVAAVLMTLTVVGAIAGVPALIGLVSSRNSSRN